ncbi:MAG TPA: DUF4239 domain-containing protein [Methylomirabilota bacterium]|nr:DUF4239 domain-containing protein [Methylomirabilota bacterium]
MISADFSYVGIAIAALLLVAIVAMLELGRRLGLRRAGREGEGEGTGALAGAVYGLLALLIAFTFSGATGRFDERRHLVVQEANAIGTAYLRIDMAASGAQPALRDGFRRYLDARIEAYKKLPDLAAAYAELEQANRLQGEIWAQAVAATRMPDSHPSLGVLLLPALNEMFDITTTRTVAARIHPPVIIFAMLIALALVAAVLAGHDLARGTSRRWLHTLGYAAILSVTIYVIIDIEFPRLGLIRVDAIDQVLVDLRAGMK